MSKNRVEYLDLARGLAVFFMVMQHTVIIHARGAGEGDGLLGNVLLLLGTAPAAPVFMLLDSNALSDYGAALVGLVVLAASHALMTRKPLQALFNRI